MSYLSTLNTLLTSTTSRYTSLRRTLLTTSEDDSSIDDPESSHVSRVLRAYYTEKGRPFPAWLGPDPRSTSSSSQGFETGRLGSLRGGQRADTNLSRGNSSAGLSELFTDSPGAAPGRSEEAPISLRRGLGGRNIGPRTQSQQPQQEGLSVRPLPSQRAGSYQTQNQALQQQQGLQPTRTASPVPPGSSGGSVQERLKARLGGGSLRGSSTSSAGGNPYEERAGGRYR